MKTSSSTSGLEVVNEPATGRLLAYIIRREFRGSKYNFPTAATSALQLGINFYSGGETIQPHHHPAHPRTINATQEFITISDGEVVLHLYDDQRRLVSDVPMKAGDSVLLVDGGHGFTVKKDAKLTEIKLGPYNELEDKVRFDPAR
jgi:hypothetical protein